MSYLRNTPRPGDLTGSLKMNLTVFFKKELAISPFENTSFHMSQILKRKGKSIKSCAHSGTPLLCKSSIF